MREQALKEAHHPVQCCFIGLAGVATMLIAIASLPYSQPLAFTLFVLGAGFTLGFALWRTGLLWQGERDSSATTPVLYLPTVAGGFVTAAGASALGYPDWGQLAFGASLFSWLAIESVLLHRLYTIAGLPVPLRPTLGIQLAPPVVGAVAYLSVNGGNPDLIAHALSWLRLATSADFAPDAALDHAAALCALLLGVQFRRYSLVSGGASDAGAWRSWRCGDFGSRTFRWCQSLDCASRARNVATNFPAPIAATAITRDRWLMMLVGDRA